MQKFNLIPRHKFLYLLVGEFSLLPFLFILYSIWKVPIFNLSFVLLILLTEIRFIYWIKQESITISDVGIIYDTPGMILEVRWEDLYKISHCWRFLIRQECLVVDVSKMKIRQWAAYANSYSSIWENYPQNAAIPLSCFDRHWRDSELGEKIKQYAPHLFEKEKSTQSA